MDAKDCFSVNIDYFNLLKENLLTGRELMKAGSLPGYGITFNLESMSNDLALAFINKYGSSVLQEILGIASDFPRDWLYFPEKKGFLSKSDIHSSYLKLNNREFNLIKKLSGFVENYSIELDLNLCYEKYLSLSILPGKELEFIPNAFVTTVNFPQKNSKLVVNLIHPDIQFD